LLTDAAHIIFETAKKRCYVLRESPENFTSAPKDVIEISDDEDAWEALEEAEGVARPARDTTDTRKKATDRHLRPAWLPKNVEPVLEELPKWHLLAETVKEIEEEIIRQDSLSTSASKADPHAIIPVDISIQRYVATILFL
jgi:DNA excision repair protein ERCC-4